MTTFQHRVVLVAVGLTIGTVKLVHAARQDSGLAPGGRGGSRAVTFGAVTSRRMPPSIGGMLKCPAGYAVATSAQPR